MRYLSLSALGLLGALACHDSAGPEPGSLDAEARRLEALSREAGRSGDTERAGMLGSAVAAIRAGATLTNITVTEGGQPREYSAVALEIQLPPSAVPFPSAPELPALHTLIAWSGAQADQVLHATIFGDSADFGFAEVEAVDGGTSHDPGEARIYPLTFGFASLHRRATREALWATDGFAVVRRTGALEGPCALPPRATATCSRAHFAVRFDAAFEAVPHFLEPSPAEPAPAVTLAAESQSVGGAQIQPTCPPAGLCAFPGAPIFPPLPRP